MEVSSRFSTNRKLILCHKDMKPWSCSVENKMNANKNYLEK
jgi:hypothetical protein